MGYDHLLFSETLPATSTVKPGTAAAVEAALRHGFFHDGDLVALEVAPLGFGAVAAMRGDALIDCASTDVVGVVLLIDHVDARGFTVKPLRESCMGAGGLPASPALLALLTPTTDEAALEWRAWSAQAHAAWLARVQAEAAEIEQARARPVGSARCYAMRLPKERTRRTRRAARTGG